MLQSKANWKYTSLQEEAVEWEDDAVALSPIVKQLLQQRGITSIEEARQFLSPDIKNLHSPLKIDSIE